VRGCWRKFGRRSDQTEQNCTRVTIGYKNLHFLVTGWLRFWMLNDSGRNNLEKVDFHNTLRRYPSLPVILLNLFVAGYKFAKDAK